MSGMWLVMGRVSDELQLGYSLLPVIQAGHSLAQLGSNESVLDFPGDSIPSQCSGGAVPPAAQQGWPPPLHGAAPLLSSLSAPPLASYWLGSLNGDGRLERQPWPFLWNTGDGT